jgi:hypothetical protein
MYSEPYLEISIHLVDIEDTLLAGKCNEPLEMVLSQIATHGRLWHFGRA